MPLIEIVEPKESWPSEFEAIASELKNALGSLAVRIDHIGSTAVPGLPAKDIIDIQVTVENLDSDEFIPLSINAGFRHREDITHDLLTGLSPDSPELQKKYFRDKEGDRTAHIHVRELGRINQKYPILFRDFLRADEVHRIAYGDIKRELAKRFPDDPDSYYDIKDPVMDMIYRAACLWEKDR